MKGEIRPPSVSSRISTRAPERLHLAHGTGESGRESFPHQRACVPLVCAWPAAAGAPVDSESIGRWRERCEIRKDNLVRYAADTAAGSDQCGSGGRRSARERTPRGRGGGRAARMPVEYRWVAANADFGQWFDRSRPVSAATR